MKRRTLQLSDCEQSLGVGPSLTIDQVMLI